MNSRLASKIEEMLSEICLMEVVASTLIICLLEYYCMMVENRSSLQLVKILITRKEIWIFFYPHYFEFF